MVLIQYNYVITAWLLLLNFSPYAVTFANQYDPHVYPSKGPFFEGWYARIIDTENSRSFGVLFGRVLPASPTSSTSSLSTTYLSFVRSKGVNQSMEVIDIFPDEENISVTVRGGSQITGDPDDPSPPYFEWVARPYGYFNVTPNGTVFDFEAQGIRFSGSFGKPVAWGPNGEGPEGWLKDIPFVPLHWFVYSLATSGNYTWVNQESSENFQGQATVHQEKNWGDSFPPSWIWTQGVNEKQNTAYAGSFGVVNFGPVGVPAHLYGYRNFKKNITLNFRPDNSYVTKSIYGCYGKVAFTITSLTHKIELNIVTPTSTLDKCLLGPTVKGFAPICVESYVASTETTVYKLGGSGYTKIDYSVFENAALEFGGGYICPSGPCE
ncbi:uncharacterized protein [Amphiura filiformis]|uniref:uncharacterized protein n=1 Tax=Amphiura filiformis TaxID=82378 RepID=UPI003B224266